MLALQNMASLLSNMAAAAQGAFGTILNFATGTIFAALNEGVASVMLWLQWLLVLLYLKIRAATATGDDLDSWMADFGVTREPAVAATGLVTFTRFTATASATVPVGSTVLTGDLSQTFAVTASVGNSYYVAGSNSYLIPAGTASAALPVQAAVAGVGGNVLAGAIALSGSALAGIDTVTNAAPFTNGDASETDPQLRSRFVTFVNTRAQATPSAIVAAIIDVQSNLIYSLFENVSSSGAAQAGNFVVVVDDGSGTPSSGLLSAISTAIVTVRPICSTWSVVGPGVTAAAVAITITPPSGTLTTTIGPAIQTAVATYIDSLPINNAVTGTTSASTLFLAQISGVVAGAAPSGTTVTGVTINGASANLVPANMGVVRASGVAVS